MVLGERVIQAGWYCSVSPGTFRTIIRVDTRPYGEDWLGPYPTFTEAKLAAIAYFEREIALAEQAIEEITALAKLKLGRAKR